eukprot:m.170944 g.170944  ORF g.170944 m.170944 type:complete len:78 (-) comp13493_c0_seq40:2244-2477(-)
MIQRLPTLLHRNSQHVPLRSHHDVHSKQTKQCPFPKKKHSNCYPSSKQEETLPSKVLTIIAGDEITCENGIKVKKEA